MPDRTGTVERVVLELGTALREVKRLLGPEEALATIAQFGVAFPPQLLAHPGFATARSATVAAATDLDEAMQDLMTAIADEDTAQIVLQGARVFEAATRVTGSFGDLQAQLQVAGPTMPGVNAAQIAELTTDLPTKLFNFLVVEQLDTVPAVGGSLTLLGLLERTFHPAAPGNPTSTPFETARLRFDRLGPLLTGPEQYFEDLYDWDSAGFDGDRLLRAVDELVAGMGLPSRFEPAAGGQPARVEAFALALTPSAGSPPGLDVELLLPIGGGIDRDLALPHPAWKGHVKATAAAGAGAGGTIRPPLQITLRPPSGEIRGDVDLTVLGAPSEPFVLVGLAGGSRLEIGEVDLNAGFDVSWNVTAGEAKLEPRIAGAVRGGKLVIDTSQADGFISKLLSGFELEAEFGAGLTWSSDTGVRFEGSSTIEIALPIHVQIGPIKIPALYLILGFQDGEFPLELSADMSAELGPLTAVASRIGLGGQLSFPAGGGNLGPGKLTFAFKPPSGVGLSLDAGIVKGGGFLYIDAERGEYVGALELDLNGIASVKAIGLITTRMPDGSSGFSLLIIITAEFGTGVQLGFGFTLLAVGGLVGLNRSMRLQPLAEGMRTGAVEKVTFPEGVVANAPKIISDLRAFFPPEAGKTLIGPMAKLGWGTPTLVSLSLGVIIEIPGNVAIVGVLRIALPTQDAALVVLQVNFIGAIEFDKRRFWFFASLYESRVVFLTIEGELGVLAAFGDDANFVLSVGGFHPQFNPPPLPFPSPRRISLNILNEPAARIRVEGYFAVTTNTVQFGARAELFFGFSACSIEGHLGFDALFQFTPFRFVIEISFSVSLKVFGLGLFGIRLRFALEGPSAWRAHGAGSISFFFFEIEVPFDITWGEQRDTTLPPIEVMSLLEAEARRDDNWRASLPTGTRLLVSLRQLDPAQGLVLHPVGTLSVSQRAVPLDVRIAKVGNQKPSDATYFSLTVETGGLAKFADVEEAFAPAQFEELGDAEKLSRPAFEPRHGGIELSVAGNQLASGAMVKRVVRYDLITIDTLNRRFKKRFFLYSAALFAHFLKGSSVSLSVLSQAHEKKLRPFVDTIEVAPETFAVAFTDTNATFAAESAGFTSFAVAQAYAAQAVADDPSLEGTLHVIPQFEVAA